MPKSELNALTLVAVLIAAGFAPGESSLVQPLLGIALLLILFAFDREGYRSSTQSLAFGSVAGSCVIPIVLPILAYLKLSLPGIPWAPIVWIVGALIFWAIDLSRMGKRVSIQQQYVPQPATVVPAPPPPPRPAPEPISAPRPSSNVTSLFSQPATVRAPEPTPVPAPPPPPLPPEPVAPPMPAAQPVQVPRGSGKPATIYLNLVGEGIAVMRSVQAEHVGKDYYLIVEEMPPGESWEFRTGQVVRCQKRNLSSGKGLVAVEEAPRAS